MDMTITVALSRNAHGDLELSMNKVGHEPYYFNDTNTFTFPEDRKDDFLMAVAGAFETFEAEQAAAAEAEEPDTGEGEKTEPDPDSGEPPAPTE